MYGLCLFAFGCSVVAIADCSFFLAEYDELDASLSNHDYDFGNSDSDFDFSYPPSSYYGYRNLGKKRYKKMYAFGAFTYDYDRDKHRCVAYTDDMLKDFSLATNAGRGFGVLASLLTAAVVFLFTIMLLVSFGPRTRRILWNINIIMMVIAIPSQLLTFLAMLQDECNDADLCVIGIAGGFSVLAVILFIAIAISMATCARPPVRAVLSFSEKSTHRKGFG